MKGTYTTLYFSRKYDADLLELYRQLGRKEFIKVLKDSVRMLIRPGYVPASIRMADISPLSSSLLLQGEEPDTSMSLVVSFAAKTDEDILTLLHRVVPGKLSLFVKNAMRMAVGPYFILGCLLTGGDSSLNASYRDRCMFFVQTVDTGERKSDRKQGLSASKKPKCAKPKADALEDAKALTGASASRDHREESFTQEKKEPEIESIQEPLFQSVEAPENGAELSDDDVLSLLENM